MLCSTETLEKNILREVYARGRAGRAPGRARRGVFRAGRLPHGLRGRARARTAAVRASRERCFVVRFRKCSSVVIMAHGLRCVLIISF